MYFPLTGARVIGTDGYLAIPVAFGLALPITMVARHFTNHYPGLTMIEYTPLIIGKTLGFLYNLLYLGGLLMITIAFLQEVIGIAYGFLINRAPLSFVTLLMVGAVVYISYYGITSVARLASFLFPAALFWVLLSSCPFKTGGCSTSCPSVESRFGTYLNGEYRAFISFIH